jgi:signal transduction histidine kinase
MRSATKTRRSAIPTAGRRELVSAISGSSAYHILILSGLGILLGAALARRGPAASPIADRWAIASGMLVGLQGLRLLTAAWAPASIFLPLLDRLFTVLLPALLGWAALGPESGEVADRVLIGVVVVSGVWFAASALLGTNPSDFNTSVFDEVWSLLALATSGGALLAVLVKRPPQWGIFAGALAILLAGDLAHIATMPITASSAPYVLLAEALAVPLFTIGAIWTLLREPASLGALPEAFPASRSLSAFVEMEAADSASAYAASLTQAVAMLFQAEYCLLLTPPSPDGVLAIGAGYDTTHRKPVLGLLLEPRGCPVLAQAMAIGRSVHLPGGTHSPDARTVLRGLGLGGRSPALLVPLPGDGRTVAGLLLLSPRAQREWDDATRLALEQVSSMLGARLQAWIARSVVQAAASDVTLELDQARRRIAELESRVERTAEQPTDLIGVDDLRNELDDARRAIDILETDVDRLRSVPPPAGQTPLEDSERLRAELALALQALAEARSSPATAGAPAASATPARGTPSVSIHGARQPLTAISGYTELLLGESIGLLGTNQRRFLERIRTAVRRIDEQLSALSQTLQDSQSASVPGTNDLASLIEQALEVIHEDLRAKDLSVRLDLPASPVGVPGDPTSLRTIVSRLLANAADASPPGREIVLSVLPDAAVGIVLLTVSDVGRGVAASDLGRVFSADVWQDPVPGLGRDASGLAMVKNLSEALGGRVWVDSRPGGGTTFSVLLPSSVGK